MGKLDALNAQLQAKARGETYKTPEVRLDGHIKAICEAIRGIDLTIDQQEGYDYTPEMQKLGKVVTEALKAHGDALINAFQGLTVNVEAPQVTVESPQVNVEIEPPEIGKIAFDIERDSNGFMKRIVTTPYQPEAPRGQTYEME